MNEIAPTPNLIGIGIEAFQQTNPKSLAQVEQHAKEFEGLFISLLVKEMRNTTEEGGFFGGEASDSFGSLFDMFIGEHLAESQPLGIASLLLEQYQRNSLPSTPADDPRQPTPEPTPKQGVEP